MKRLLFISSLLAAIIGWSDPITYTGSAGTKNYRTSLNAQMDSDDKSLYLWSDHEAAQPDRDYYIGKAAFFSGLGSTKFNGKSLEVGNAATVNMNVDQGEAYFTTLTVDAGAKFSANFDWAATTPSVKSLKGTLWEINGTLAFSCQRQYGIFSLDVPVTGSGCVEFGGYVKGTWAGPRGENQRITSDNSAFTGKFLVNLPNTVDKGESCARGVEISAASALGGDLDVATPDALTLSSWNGLVAKETLVLNAANRGITLNANAFFDVDAGKSLTIMEPIRSVGGFFKRGKGTLALGGGISFGKDGTSSANGVNSALAVKEGVLRVTQANDLKDLDVLVAHGASLELVGTTTARFRSLKAAGILTIDVDCTGLESGSTQTITLNMPKSDAEALVGKVDVMAKGGYASIGSDLTVTESGATVTLKVPSVTVWHDYTGTSGTKNYATSWNGKMDGDDSSKYLWSSHDVAIVTDGYVVNTGFDVLLCNPSTFAGGSLHVKSNMLSGEGKDKWNYVVPNLTVDAGATFRARYSNGDATYPTWLKGDLWRIDGTLGVMALNNGFGCPTVPMIGSGTVIFGGWGWSTKARDQRLESDNSRFRGKFSVNLPKTADGAEYAVGLRIIKANALGGALGEMTPDALTLEANNGLIIADTLSLATENRGILMKQGAYLEVTSGKSLTLDEPIRVVNGILKKGAGTLAFGSSDVTLGEDGAAVANGINNKLEVKAGAIRPTGTVGMGKLTLAFDDGSSLEIDGTAEDVGLKQYGLYQPNGMTIAGASLPVKVFFAPGADVAMALSIPLVTVPAVDAEALAAKIRGNVTVEGLAHRPVLDVTVNPVDNGLACIRLDIVRKGLILIFQ